MGDYVRFTKNGLKDFSWSGKTREYEEVESKATFVTCLRQECRIDDDVTLKDIFAAVEKDELLKHFISMYSWCRDIDDFLKDIKKTPKEEDKSEKIYYLEIYVDAEGWTYEKKKLIPTFNFSVGFHGIGEADENSKKAGFDTISYSVSLSPMWQLANLPVRLNKEIKIYHYNEKLEKGYKPEIIFEGEYTFSLLDVLDAIFDDISFYGGPKESADLLEDLCQQVKRIKLED